jgi:hypothetical protein
VFTNNPTNDSFVLPSVLNTGVSQQAA